MSILDKVLTPGTLPEATATQKGVAFLPGASENLIDVRQFTTSTTYTPPSGAKAFYAILTSGGGYVGNTTGFADRIGNAGPTTTAYWKIISNATDITYSMVIGAAASTSNPTTSRRSGGLTSLNVLKGSSVLTTINSHASFLLGPGNDIARNYSDTDVSLSTYPSGSRGTLPDPSYRNGGLGAESYWGARGWGAPGYNITGASSNVSRFVIPVQGVVMLYVFGG